MDRFIKKSDDLEHHEDLGQAKCVVFLPELFQSVSHYVTGELSEIVGTILHVIVTALTIKGTKKLILLVEFLIVLTIREVLLFQIHTFKDSHIRDLLKSHSVNEQVG